VLLGTLVDSDLASATFPEISFPFAFQYPDPHTLTHASSVNPLEEVRGSENSNNVSITEQSSFFSSFTPSLSFENNSVSSVPQCQLEAESNSSDDSVMPPKQSLLLPKMKSFPCPRCSRRFLTSYGLRIHMEQQHHKNYTCNRDHCPRNLEPFKSKKDLKRHVTSVHGPCTILPCGASLKNRKDNIERHAKPSVCNICSNHPNLLSDTPESRKDEQKRRGRKRKSLAS